MQGLQGDTEEELQRRELSRLLSTAKDKDRQDLIRKAIQALDEQEKLSYSGVGELEGFGTATDHDLPRGDRNAHPRQFGGPAALNPAIASSLLDAHSIPSLETMSAVHSHGFGGPGAGESGAEGARSTRMRPMSARRRSSVPNLLDAIPEVIARNSAASPHKNAQRRQHDGSSSSGAGGSSYGSGGFGGGASSSGGGGGGGGGGVYGNAGINRSVSSGGDDKDSLLPIEDVAEAVASCFDSRCPPKIIFKHSYKGPHAVGYSLAHSMSAIRENLNMLGEAADEEGGDGGEGEDGRAGGYGGGGITENSTKFHLRVQSITSKPPSHQPARIAARPLNCWVSTAMVPQFICVGFFEKWIVKKLEVRCSGIEELCMQINPNASWSPVSTARLTDMHQSMGNRGFVWEAVGDEDTYDQHGGGIPGIGLTFLVRRTSRMFIRICEVKVTVFPYS